MSENTIFRLLETLGLPVVYGFHTERPDLPYLNLLGDGQYQFPADDNSLCMEVFMLFHIFLTAEEVHRK